MTGENKFSQIRYPITVIKHVDEVVIDDAVMVCLLKRHGCTISKTTVLFPTGTFAREIWPRWGLTERYELVLPDGLELLWKQNRSMWEPGYALLQVSRTLYEQEQERLAAQGLCGKRQP